MVFHFDGVRDAVLHRSTVVVAEPGRDIADPRGLDAADAARGHEHVEEDVRDGADQRQVAPALANQLVARGEGDEGFQRRAHADRGAVGHEARHRFAHRDDLLLGHPAILTRKAIPFLTALGAI